MSQDVQARLEFARKMEEQLRAAILRGDSTVQVVSTDGVSVTYTRAQALREYNHWQKQVDFLSGRRSRHKTINLSNGHE